ncbi:FHF complex subunit HOOK interacting protein 2B isoform X3 [Lates calcarifer]|uniref:FHF complex subunit HOOK interacting protein 2B isoform X3 n=1 Tax=Lates calcarifer TaxID=8187 RepID=A0AAJ8DNM5_LATCA|nr:FHF complex subunit HOOK interacting protein 2B isoform X3 [Lates calcarifer]
METFSKLTRMLLHALETREPTVDLLDSFVDHWKSITNYYIETTDDSRPVRQTEIPWRLRQMLDILVYEEKQQGVEETGACLEYLLQHKLLETLCTLGKAQYPPGMSQQVLLFFCKFLSQMQRPVLHLVNVYRPVQVNTDTPEKEEAQFLLVICSRIKQDPDTLRHVLEILDQPAARTPASDQSQLSTQASNHRTETPPSSSQSDSCSSSLVQSESSASSPIQSESSLLSALLQLTKSQRGSVSLKAYESLLLVSGLQSGSSGETLTHHTQLGELLAGRLLELYSLLPMESLDPGLVQSWPPTTWSSQFSRRSSDLRSESPASDHVTNFFSWFDFLDHLMREAPQVLSVKLAQCVRQVWLSNVLQPQLLHTCEQMVLVSTSVLCAAVRLVQSLSLLDQLVHFLLRTESLSHLLLQRCDHISDQISMASLSLVEELLQKPHRDILDVLVLGFLQSRSYLSPPAAGVDDRHTEVNETGDSDLEEDPFFSDSLFPDTQLLPPPPLSSSAPPPPSGLGSAADVINSFLCLVPVQVRSAQLLQEGGYESYVHDAHTLVTECQSLSLSWDWPISLLPPSSSGEGEEFFEGHLFKVLFDRLGRILEQPYELNLQLTAVLSRLSAFSHPLLHEYLLNPYIHLSRCSRSLFSVLIRVMGELMQRIQQISNLTDRLLNTRRHLLGLNHNTGLEHLTLLRGVIVLEEFCKELAAIAFVKLPLDQN